MARFKVIHSDDAACIDIRGDKRNPEPASAIVKFPGGNIEVSRTSDGQYWVHLSVDDPKNIVDSRIDYSHEEYKRRHLSGEPTIPPVPAADCIRHAAFRVAPNVVTPTGE